MEHFQKYFQKYINKKNMPNKKHIDSNALLLDLYSEIALLIISGQLISNTLGHEQSNFDEDLVKPNHGLLYIHN